MCRLKVASLFVLILRILVITWAFGGADLKAQDQKNINVQRLGVEDGLSHYTVNSIYEDEFGFIWIGTKDGLNRYNGKNIEVFKPSRTNKLSLSENNIRNICGDRNGHLYIKGLESLTEFDMRTYKFKVISETDVKAIFYAKGFLWIAKGRNIYRYDRESQKQQLFFSFDKLGLNDIAISHFLVDKNGSVHLSTIRNGYYEISKGGKIENHVMSVSSVNSMIEDATGNVWVATSNQGLYCIGKNKGLLHYNTSASVGNNLMRTICEDRRGNIFVATYGGLFKFDTALGRFTELKYLFKRTGLNIRSITTMTFDRQGTLWLGTFFEGIHRYNPDYDTYKYHHLANEIDQKRYPIITSIIEDKSGKLWFGTEGEGLSAFDPISNRTKSYRKEQISSDVVKSLAYDSSTNILWVATLRNGIDRIDLDNNQIRHIQNTITETGGSAEGNAENIIKMFSRGDSLYLCTNSGLVVLNKTTCKITRYNTKFNPNYIKQVWDANIDAENNLWICYSMDIIKVFLKSNTERRYTFKEIAGSSVNNNFNVMLYDSHKRLWFGSTGSGFFRYSAQKDKFFNYNSSNGLGNDYITGMAEDSATGNLYITTNDGISKFDPKSNIAENYNIKNGFPFTVIDEKSLYLTRQGELYASGYSGLISVNVKDLNDKVQDYQVFITDIAVNNKPVLPNDGSNILDQSVLYQKKVTLRPEHSIISFGFGTNNLLNSKFSQVEYMLKGFDERFIKANNSHIASYTNLNPGNYSFIVKGSATDKQGKHPQIALQLIVLPPFYRTWWFESLMLILALAITVYLIRSYVQGINLQASLTSEKREKEHIEQVNQSKLRFFTNVAHEFRTPLTLINSQLELLLEHDGINPHHQEKILSAYQNALKMRKLADEIIDFRKQESGFMKLKLQEHNIVLFLENIFHAFEEYAAIKNTTFTFSSAAIDLKGFIDAEQFEKVINNLLSNALKYTRPGDSILIDIAQETANIVINVKDSGVGIASNDITHVFEPFYQADQVNMGISNSGSGIGLSYAKAIVEMHGGTLSVQSLPDKETIFTIIIPMTSATLIYPLSSTVIKGNNEVALQNDLQISNNPLNADSTDDRPSMLIVEDNAELRSMLIDIFKTIYIVESAPNGREGLEKISILNPDIILSDVLMPEMSGIEMCTLIKSNFETCHIPVVLLTARSADEHIIEGLQTGADDYVVKPFSVKQLIARCHNLISGRKKLQERFLRTPDAKVNILSNNDFDHHLLTKAVDYINLHLDDPDLNIKQLSNELGLSRTSMFAKIKGLTGQTPNDFINTIRLKKAVELLVAEPELANSEIAYKVGFSSSSYFIKCFKDTYGKTPAAFKKVS